jgi:hypothetical protein
MDYLAKAPVDRSQLVLFANKLDAAIGARAAVAKDIPPNAIAVGIPAKVIRYRWKNAGGGAPAYFAFSPLAAERRVAAPHPRGTRHAAGCC